MCFCTLLMFICPMKVNETVQQRRERAKFNCKNNHLIFSRTEPNRAQQNDTHSSTIIIHNTSNCEFGVFVFVSIWMLSFLFRICQTLLLLLLFSLVRLLLPLLLYTVYMWYVWLCLCMYVYIMGVWFQQLNQWCRHQSINHSMCVFVYVFVMYIYVRWKCQRWLHFKKFRNTKHFGLNGKWSRYPTNIDNTAIAF